ncbi:MAG: NADH-quinone oxidoreductase subunit M [Planctomycetota bacterium]|nr:NADH-quinone oxidoreductase subunit M [Planctomycetota bacterium]
MILGALIVVPLLFAAVVIWAPEARAKTIALAGTLVAIVLGAYAAVSFDWGYAARFQFGSERPLTWMGELGLKVSLGVDSVALLLVLLTVLLGPICVLCSWTAITERVRTYYAWLLVLQAAMTGVFCARDIILFYVCFEFTLVPMFVLISLYGSTNRRKAAVKFFLYTFTGSVIALAGLLYVAWFATTTSGGKAAGWTFDIATLEAAARAMSPREQALVMLALLAGFAVKVPLFPVHTWLPLAHTEAPTAGSVILAGVLLKLGTYALFRFVLPFTPVAVLQYAPLIAVLCIVGILYAGLICWVQTDVKKLVAYSSVAHLGFCVLGLFALNNAGITGSVLYMINHGLSTGALFLLIGMMYERLHTRSMKEIGGLGAYMPVWSTFMVFFVMASVGLPGLNGFVSEFLCLLGAFQASSAWGSGLWGSLGTPVGATPGDLGPWFAAIAGVGMIVAAMYLLYMLGRVVWGPLVLPKGHAHHSAHAADGAHAAGGTHGPSGTHAGDAAHAGPAHGPGHGTDHAHTGLPRDLTSREIGLLLPLAALCLLLGLYPKPLLDTLQPPIERTVAIYENELREPQDTIRRAAAQPQDARAQEATP